jgi:hypothetical protein
METTMMELHRNGYYPLTGDRLCELVPQRPGIFLLAIQLANGVHQPFYTDQTENLYRSLSAFLEWEDQALPEMARMYLEKFQAYFTFYEIVNPAYRRDIEKLLAMTADPVAKLQVVFEQ